MIADVMVSEGIAILPGPRTSFLDHLMPLCHLWNIPLLCTDAWVATCAQTFYPPTQLIMADHESFQQQLSAFRTFVTVEPCRLHPEALQFGSYLYRGEGKTVAGFHGNPSKFREEYWIERYVDEDTVLVYGQYLIDYFQKKGVWQRLKQTVRIGNVRKTFYEAHKPFFDAAIKPYLFPVSDKETVLWAPTWSYPDPPSGYEAILDNVPSDLQLFVKWHPFMHRLYPQEVASLQEHYAAAENIRFLDEVPLIYPLIEKADYYIGDSSSVAFDFLSLDRPVFVCGKQTYSWATHVPDKRHLFAAMRQKDTLSEMRQKAYRYVFGT